MVTIEKQCVVAEVKKSPCDVKQTTVLKPWVCRFDHCDLRPEGESERWKNN